MIKYEQEMVPFEKLQREHDLSSLTGDAIYQKLGLKREEILFGYSAQYDDGHKMTVDMVVGDGKEKSEWRILLFDGNGNKVDDSSENYDNSATIFRCDDAGAGTTYIFKIKIEQCCIPIRYPVNEIYVKKIAFCDSQKLASELAARNYDIFSFVKAKNPCLIIPKKAFEECIVFVYDEDLKKPFSFPHKDGWKYAAFFQAMANPHLLDSIIDK